MATITAAPPSAGNADQSLPDPSRYALIWLAGGVIVAAVAAIVLNAAGWTGRPFTPPANGAGISVFAGVYTGAQIIERAMEFVVPLLPVPVPTGANLTQPEKVAQVKADRAKMALAVAAVLGVVVSCAFGLFLLETIGIHTGSNTVDSLVTGLLIAAGTKPLHDFISGLQSKSAPQTGSEVT